MTWAGDTASGAHPRSRGENRQGLGSRRDQEGSSPLTRGKRPRQVSGAHGCGLIPAHAGKTFRGWRGWFRARAHPRSRGENESRHSDNPEAVGSSPLTRGKRGGGGLRECADGLIPAHAGKTPSTRRNATNTRAHPRSRGENPTSIIPWGMGVGSSPLTRGKPLLAPHAAAHTGLIPAHAGKTVVASRRSRCPRAHPRSRGENETQAANASVDAGSSPLTRGKPQPGDQDGNQAGLIPAHAGKTTSSSASPTTRRAHPRSRGENCLVGILAAMTVGSSPLTRGKPHKALT